MARGQKTGGRKKGSLNKATAEVKALAQQYTSQAITVLHTIMVSSTNELARIAAAREILDRGHGKARQPLSHEGLQPARLAIVNITTRAEMQTLLGQALDTDAGALDDGEDGDA